MLIVFNKTLEVYNSTISEKWKMGLESQNKNTSLVELKPLIKLQKLPVDVTSNSVWRNYKGAISVIF